MSSPETECPHVQGAGGPYSAFACCLTDVSRRLWRGCPFGDAPAKQADCPIRALAERAVPDDIVREMEYQKMQWGGPEHDDLHSADDWARIIREEVHEAVALRDEGPEHQIAEVKQVAAVALAWFQSLQRARTAKAAGEGEG